jgi:hypothetical protein
MAAAGHDAEAARLVRKFSPATGIEKAEVESLALLAEARARRATAGKRLDNAAPTSSTVS